MNRGKDTPNLDGRWLSNYENECMLVRGEAYTILNQDGSLKGKWDFDYVDGVLAIGNWTLTQNLDKTKCYWSRGQDVDDNTIEWTRDAAVDDDSLLPSPDPTSQNAYDLEDLVWITGERLAKIKFKGFVNFSSGVHYGVELHGNERGDTDGNKDGKRYFTCKRNGGMFIKKTEILGVCDLAGRSEDDTIYYFTGIDPQNPDGASSGKAQPADRYAPYTPKAGRASPAKGFKAYTPRVGGMAEAQEDGPRFRKGDRVWFYGLSKQKWLNGSHAVLEEWDDINQRWQVTLEDGMEIAAFEKNLILSTRDSVKLPAGWEEVKSKTTGRMYYFNMKTGRCLWNLPKKGQAGKKEKSQELPKNWTQVKSKSSGRSYYFNEKTGQCVWNVEQIDVTKKMKKKQQRLTHVIDVEVGSVYSDYDFSGSAVRKVYMGDWACIEECRGRKARISFPVKGWCTFRLPNGDKTMKRLDTYIIDASAGGGDAIAYRWEPRASARYVSQSEMAMNGEEMKGTCDPENKNWVRLTNGRWLPIYIGEHRVLVLQEQEEEGKEDDDEFLPTAMPGDGQGFKNLPNIDDDPTEPDDNFDDEEENDVVAPLISKGVGHLGKKEPVKKEHARRPTAIRPLTPEQQAELLAKVGGDEEDRSPIPLAEDLAPDEYILTFHQRPLGLTVWRNDDAHTIIHEIDSKDLEDQGAKCGDRIVMVNGDDVRAFKYPSLLYKLRTETLPLAIIFKRSDDNLPAPWTKVWSQSQNKPYFFNNVTGDCVWDVAEVYAALES